MAVDAAVVVVVLTVAARLWCHSLLIVAGTTRIMRMYGIYEGVFDPSNLREFVCCLMCTYWVIVIANV